MIGVGGNDQHGVSGSQDALGERITLRRLNIYLWHRRFRATCKNGPAHSGSLPLADKEEGGGSSPPRPTTLALTSTNGHSQSLLDRLARVTEPISEPHSGQERLTC